MSADPRVEALIAWAWQRTDKLAGPPAATLVDTPSSPAAAAELASAAAGAYACRAVRAGNRIVALLGELGEPGARELVRLRDSVRYRDARNTIEKTLRRLSHELRIPAGELEDRFEGIALYRSLSTRVAVGRYVAVIRVSDDLRQVNTAWHDRTGRLLTRRPSAVAGRTDELAEVDDVRTRLRAHVAAVRERLEQTMVQGRSWTAEEWAASMFADPLRAAMAKRMIWRIDSTAPVLAIVTDAGLRDLDDLPVSLDPRDSIAVWHPADDPAAQPSWSERLDSLGIDQPIAQANRDVVLAETDTPRLSIAVGRRVLQRPFRGFLRGRRWQIPYMGRWFFIPQATLEVTRHGPIAVLEVDLDHGIKDNDDILVLGTLGFRSILDADLDARELPRSIVSEAARDLLGAVAVAKHPSPPRGGS